MLQHLQTPVQTEIEPQKPICIRKGLQSSVKRIGAVQVFCPKVSRVGDLNTGKYRFSKIFDDFSFSLNPYSGRIRPFRVSTAYKTKANKVRPVDSSETDGSKPGGSLDWFEKSKLDDIPCLDPGQYPDWITPKFSDIPKGSQLTKEQIERLVVGDSLWSKEKELFIEMLYNREKALAFDFSEIRKVKPDVALP